MVDTDFFAFTSKDSLLRTFCIIISTIFLILSPPFLFFVIRYEKNIHRRTILNYFACDFCYVFICSFVLVQTLEIARFIVGPMPNVLCYYQTTMRGILVNSFIFIINFQAIIKYVLIFIWKSPFIFRDDFWYFYIKMLIIFIVIIIQFLIEFFRRFRTFEFYFCAGMEPEVGNSPRYLSFIILAITIGLQLGLFLRKLFYWRSLPSGHVFKERNSEIEMDSVLNVFSTASSTFILSLASFVFFGLSKVKPENLGNPPYIYILYWRVFLFPPFSFSIVCFMILKNKKFRNHLRNTTNNNELILTIQNFFNDFSK
jgi:hypothetical protein